MSDDKMSATFINEFPGVDAQQLRTLIRNARKEQAESKPPKSFRLLFQLIKQAIPEPGKPRQQSADAAADDVEGEEE